jgi:LCP family protein required for cell wall assembly
VRARARHRTLRYLALAATAVVVAVPVGAFALAHQLQGQIDTVDSDKILPKVAKPSNPKDPDPGNDLNILLLGSDSRAGKNNDFAGDKNGGQRSDVTIIAHISAKRDRIDMVSIPRDTMVQIPACKVDTKGTDTRPSFTLFNAAFSFGADAAKAAGDSTSEQVSAGALCTWQTVEKVTDVPIDGFVVVDFAGVVKMVDALHGVPMCVTSDVDSPQADHLKLTAGFQTLDGWHAVEYARARHGVQGSDASDTGRILRQQALLGSIANEVFSKNLLTNAPQLLRFFEATAGSLTMNKKLGSLTYLSGLGYSLRHVDSSDIRLITAPYETYVPQPAQVQFAPAATAIFQDLRHDTPFVKTAKPKGGSTGSGTSSPSPHTTHATTVPNAVERATQGLAASEVATTKAECDAQIAASKPSK